MNAKHVLISTLIATAAAAALADEAQPVTRTQLRARS